MTVRSVSLAAAFLTAGLSAAPAAEIRPRAAASLDLGSLSGVAYYTAGPKGYHIVVTLAPRGAAPAMRLETVLTADQSVTLSTPRMPGEPAQSVEIARAGDRVTVSPAGVSGLRQADATQ